MQAKMRGVVLCVLLASPLLARERVSFWCEQGNQTATVHGYTTSTATPLQRSYPACTVTVYINGSSPYTKATLYSNNSGTVLSNPFTLGTSPETASNGYGFFYVDNGRYDIQYSSGGIPTPFTLFDNLVFDPAGGGGGGGGGSGTV